MSKEKDAHINIPKGPDEVVRQTGQRQAPQSVYNQQPRNPYTGNVGNNAAGNNPGFYNNNTVGANAPYQASNASTRPTPQPQRPAQQQHPNPYFNNNYQGYAQQNIGANAPYGNHANSQFGSNVSVQGNYASGFDRPGNISYSGYSAANPNEAFSNQGYTNQVPNQVGGYANRVPSGQQMGQQYPSSNNAPHAQHAQHAGQNNPAAQQVNQQAAFTNQQAQQGQFNSMQGASQQQYNGGYGRHANTDGLDAPTKHSKKSKPKSRSSALAPILTCIICLIGMFGLAFLMREFAFQAYEIPSGSMEDTIMTGDMVFAEKVSHLIVSPQRGDIITFEDPEVEGRVLIKRCVATAGQTVDIKNNKFVVDGVEIDEPYTNGKPTKTLNRSKVAFPYTIPDGQIWVMGDNRTNSQDSRYYGSVPVSSVIGKALLVYWPTSDAKIL